ncbi:MAG: LemA family protein [Gemmatimonadales bacterium]|nr:LemA family protein [Gemmatimonadales bacterium]
MGIGAWVVIGIFVLVILWGIVTYNRMIVLRNRIDNAWSQVDVQLRRRYDLIPNLVETVKGYAAHERQTFEEVTKARQAGIDARTVQDQAQAENLITQALRRLFAVAEAYPQLRATENFQQLQEELSGTESKIAYARQFYNDTVLSFHNLIQAFPAKIVAGMGGFQKRDYFEIEEAAARGPVQVQF